MKKKDNIFKRKKIKNRLNLAQEEDVHNILHVKKTIFLKRRSKID